MKVRPSMKPLDKTLVTEVRSTLADRYTRTKVVKAAGAAALNTGPLYNGDITLTVANPHVIPEIHSTLTIVCFEPIKAFMVSGGVDVAQWVITSLFVFNGSAPGINIRLETTNPLGARIQVISH